jgi:hypothetical protein
MTALKGLLEAAVLLVIAAVAAAVIAGVWLAFGGGDFTTRFGISMAIVGALLAATGGVAFSRAGSATGFAWLGRGPERGDAGGGRVLTNVGIFLFVAVPLIVAGALLASW